MKKHLLLAAFLALSFATAESANAARYINTVPDAQGNLVIDTAEITSQASFVNYAVANGGTVIQLIVVRASNGEIRTAFNTCQSCYTSGRGYYVQEGSDLVCQNCGFHFTPDEVEITAGGCNPWPIFTENKTITEETISISYDFLTQARIIFSNWKMRY